MDQNFEQFLKNINSSMPDKHYIDKWWNKMLEEQHKKRINDPDYKAIAETRSLNSVELERYRGIISNHCCDVKLCFGKGTGVGIPVYVYTPCTSIFHEITDYDSW